MQSARERSRANTMSGHSNIDRSIHTAGIPLTQFVGYTDLETHDMTLLKTVEFPDYLVCMFDKTPCYATMGGQNHDTASWTDEQGRVREIFDVQNYNGVFLHFVK